MFTHVIPHGGKLVIVEIDRNQIVYLSAAHDVHVEIQKTCGIS